MTSYNQISNLLYRYSEAIDTGDFRSATALFTHARVKLKGQDALQDHHALLAMLEHFIQVYENGTPLTRHLTTNAIIEIDEAAGTASSRSSYVVLQATPNLSLQTIAVGRYADRFECVEGQWRFTYRDFSLFDMPGDVSHHLAVPV
jgi:3-phenylpropionate/cinnamic acid dioxygenase small subunit